MDLSSNIHLSSLSKLYLVSKRHLGSVNLKIPTSQQFTLNKEAEKMDHPRGWDSNKHVQENNGLAIHHVNHSAT